MEYLSILKVEKFLTDNFEKCYEIYFLDSETKNDLDINDPEFKNKVCIETKLYVIGKGIKIEGYLKGLMECLVCVMKETLNLPISLEDTLKLFHLDTCPDYVKYNLVQILIFYIKDPNTFSNNRAFISRDTMTLDYLSKFSECKTLYCHILDKLAAKYHIEHDNLGEERKICELSYNFDEMFREIEKIYYLDYLMLKRRDKKPSKKMLFLSNIVGHFILVHNFTDI